MTLIRTRPVQHASSITVTKVDAQDLLDGAHVAFLMSLARTTGLDPADTVIEALVQDEVSVGGVDLMMRKGVLSPLDVLAATGRFRSFHGL